MQWIPEEIFRFQNIAEVQKFLVVSNFQRVEMKDAMRDFLCQIVIKGVSYGFILVISFYFLPVSFLLRLLNEDVRITKENSILDLTSAIASNLSNK